jgi:2-hydroxy-6-oxonona-2,4-dienedioate hydrolase
LQDLPLILLLVLTIALAMTILVYRHDLSIAKSRVATGSEVLRGPDSTIEFADRGEGDVVMVAHRSGGGFDQGIAMTQHLPALGFRVVAPSRAGYLRSSMPKHFSVAMQADGYAALMAHLKIERVVMLGVSAGAWSSIEFAQRHPDKCRALILIVPADYLPEGQKMRGGWIFEAVFRSDFAAWIAARSTSLMPSLFSRAMLATDPDVIGRADLKERQRIADLLQGLLPVSARRQGMVFDIETANANPHRETVRLACPILLISARDDGFETARRAREWAKQNPMSELVIFPTGGHALVARQGEVATVIKVFLDRVK